MPLFEQRIIRKLIRNQSIKAITDAVKKQECILFLGAGVHAGPRDSGFDYPEAERPLLGNALTKELARGCDFKRYSREGPCNLQRVAMCYEGVHGRNALIRALEKCVHEERKPSRILKALAKLPFKLIITTNYDQLFETSLAEADPPKSPLVGVYNKEERFLTTDYAESSEKEPFVYKLHGDIKKPESVVITDEDYIHFVMRMSIQNEYHPVPETFRFYFKKWPTLFVGYSLLDYNLRLLFKTLYWSIDESKQKPRYSVDPYPDPMIYDVWCNKSRIVTFIAQDAWTFVPTLYQSVTGAVMP